MKKKLALAFSILFVGVSIFVSHCYANEVRAPEPILDLKAIDTTVDPCEDFYHYACGTWIKNFQLPEDRVSYNRQTDGLGEETNLKLNAILADYAKGQFKIQARYAKQLGEYYQSCMDTAAIEANAQKFVQKEFQLISSIRDLNDMAAVIAQLQLAGSGALFSFGSQPDYADSKQTISYLSQGGISFQDKSYYINTDAKSLEIIQHFTSHVLKMWIAAGESPEQAVKDAQIVLNFETILAQNSLATEDMQDSSKLNHPMDLAGVQALNPKFPWAIYFKNLGIDDSGKINVATPDFFKSLDTLLASTSVEYLKTYLKWQVLHAYAGSLSQSFRDENFDFWSHYLSGAVAQPPRWKQCTLTLKATMPEALGEAYVNSFADPNAIRSFAEAMIQEIKQAFNSNLDTLTWLDTKTRDAAKVKLTQVTDKIGYPAKWKNYDTLKVTSDFIENSQSAAIFASHDDLNKIGKPTDRTLWDMPSWEQNAYYNPPSNEMVFPLGALVPPIFDAGASLGANFGSIGGGWMGHELTHGFDSNGRRFDGAGNLHEWWTEQTSKEFDQRTQCLVDQGSRYEILPGLTVNGKQTLTENLADQGGVKMGYLALLTATAGKPPAPAVGAFNERQQYWLAYAQSWCSKETPEHIRALVATNVHPPAEFRTNTVLFNRPEFAKDFSCKAGSRMAPVNRCSVW
jgi:putative endopeptidase